MLLLKRKKKIFLEVKLSGREKQVSSKEDSEAHHPNVSHLVGL